MVIIYAGCGRRTRASFTESFLTTDRSLLSKSVYYHLMTCIVKQCFWRAVRETIQETVFVQLIGFFTTHPRWTHRLAQTSDWARKWKVAPCTVVARLGAMQIDSLTKMQWILFFWLRALRCKWKFEWHIAILGHVFEPSTLRFAKWVSLPLFKLHCQLSYSSHWTNLSTSGAYMSPTCHRSWITHPNAHVMLPVKLSHLRLTK